MSVVAKFLILRMLVLVVVHLFANPAVSFILNGLVQSFQERH